jgi:carotenoid cleavage dioxygenase-like enzyme
VNAERLLESAVAWTTRQLQKRVPYSPSNPYLEGPFAPVASEVSETQLRVTGHIPRELNGIFTRIGPNPMQVKNPATYHWFLGDGMVHGVRLRDGAALWYRNRWVGTDSANRRLGRPLATGTRRGTADVVNTNIIGHNGRLWALVEAGALPVELDSELDDGAVIADVVVYPRLFDKSHQGPENTATHLERWRLDPASGRVQRHVLSDDRQEFPRFDERRTGRPYRYAYTVGLDVQHTGAQPLYRCDLDTGCVGRHDFGPSHMPSETVFVPRTEGGVENDGWLLAYVSDLRDGTSTVVILNAQDIGGELQAVIELPARVPMGFHGNWIADEHCRGSGSSEPRQPSPWS